MKIMKNLRNKTKEIYDEMKNDIRSAAHWCEENPDLTVAICAAAGTVAVQGGKVLTKWIAANKAIRLEKIEEYRRDYTIWDASLGCWHELKKPLNGKLASKLAELEQDGYSKIEALMMLNIVK